MLNAPFGNTADAIVPTSCPGQPSRNGCPLNFLDPGAPRRAAIRGGAGFPRQGEPIILPAANVAFPLNGGYVSMPTDAKPMRSYQYNLSYQRQFMDAHASRRDLHGQPDATTSGFPATPRTRRSTFPGTASPASTA